MDSQKLVITLNNKEMDNYAPCTCKAQKYSQAVSLFCAFGICTYKMYFNLTTGRYP